MLTKRLLYSIIAVNVVILQVGLAEISPEKYRNVVVIQNTTLYSQAGINRDFQPLAPLDGDPLIASVTIESVDGSAIPTEISVKEITLLSEEEVWRPKTIEVMKSNSVPSVIEIKARGGPKWKIGITVNLIVTLEDGDGKIHYLRNNYLQVQATN